MVQGRPFILLLRQLDALAQVPAKVFDPEGILSTLPAIATTLIGVLAGKWLMRETPIREGDESFDGAVLFPGNGGRPVATALGSDYCDIPYIKVSLFELN